MSEMVKLLALNDLYAESYTSHAMQNVQYVRLICPWKALKIKKSSLTSTYKTEARVNESLM